MDLFEVYILKGRKQLILKKLRNNRNTRNCSGML